MSVTKFNFGPIHVEVELAESTSKLKEFLVTIGAEDVPPETLLVYVDTREWMAYYAMVRKTAQKAVRDLIFAYMNPSDYLVLFVKSQRGGGRKKAVEIARFAASLGDRLLEAYPFVSQTGMPMNSLKRGPKEWMPPRE